MKFQDILKLFYGAPYHYCYKIDNENKIIKEFRIIDYEEEPSDTVTVFPCEVLDFDSSINQIYSPEWTIINADGEIVKGRDD